MSPLPKLFFIFFGAEAIYSVFFPEIGAKNAEKTTWLSAHSKSNGTTEKMTTT
jgi:hypothetical protein